MSDATSRCHRHDHAGDESHGHFHGGAALVPPSAGDRPSLIETSAGARLLAVSILLAALWAGVYWAVH